MNWLNDSPVLDGPIHCLRAGKAREVPWRRREKDICAGGSCSLGGNSSCGQGASGRNDCFGEFGGLRVAGEEQEANGGTALPGICCRTEGTEYHVRQEKPADKALIPVNTSVEFTLEKDKMKFKANGKKYEYLVVSETAAPATAAAAIPKL